MTTFLGRAAAASPLGACLVFADVNGDAAVTPHPSEPYAAGVIYGRLGAQGRVGVSEPNGAFTIRGQSSIVQAFPTFSLVLQPWVAVEMDDPTTWPSTSVTPVVKTYPTCKDGYTGLYKRLSLVSVPVSSGGVGDGVVTINPLSQLGHSWAQYAQQEGYCYTASCVSYNVALISDLQVLAAKAQTQVGQVIRGNSNNERVGIAVALSQNGTIMAVGHLGSQGSDDRPGVRVWTLHEPSNTWSQLGADIDPLTDAPSSGVIGVKWAGMALAMSGNGLVLAVGADEHRVRTSTTGSYHLDDPPHWVRVYEWSGTAWVQKGQHLATDGTDYFNAGFALALSNDGTRLAIGAPEYMKKTHTGTSSTDIVNAGYVRVLEYGWHKPANAQPKQQCDCWDDLTNLQDVAFRITGDAAHDRFGFSVALNAHGTILAVGAPAFPNGDFNSQRRGRVRVFRLKYQDSASGELLPVPNDDPLCFGVFVSACYASFLHDTWQWVQMGTDISSSDPSEYAYHGVSTALNADGSILAVGTADPYPYRPACCPWMIVMPYPGYQMPDRSDYVYAFQFDAGTNAWNDLGSRLHSKNPDHIDVFGRSIALSADGTILVVSAPAVQASFESGTITNHPDRIGYVSTFRWSAQYHEWFQIGQDHMRNQALLAHSVHPVALSQDGHLLAIGDHTESTLSAGLWEDGRATVYGVPEVLSVLDLASYDPYGVLSGAVHSGQAYDGMAVRVLLQTAKVSTLAVQLASLLFGARVRANTATPPHLVEADGRSAYAALAQVLHGTPLSPVFNDDIVSGPLWDLVTAGFSKQGLGHSLWYTDNAAALAAMKACLDTFDDIRTDHHSWTDVPMGYTDASDVTLDHRNALSNVVDAISATSQVCSGAVADEMEALAKKQTTLQSFSAATSPTQLAQLVASSATGSSILRFRDACSASLSACSQHVADCCGAGTAACTPVNPFDPGSSSWCNTVG
tara:strand:- start:5424 stop:8321 length:2898 start_codon:yes stop_codon:yes gene_type:complete